MGEAVLLLFGAADTKGCKRQRLKSLFSDHTPALFAGAVALCADAFQGLCNQVQRALFVGHQAQRELLFVAVGTNICHQRWHARQCAGCRRAIFWQSRAGHC